MDRCAPHGICRRLPSPGTTPFFQRPFFFCQWSFGQNPRSHQIPFGDVCR
jgi:hypothetical protein